MKLLIMSVVKFRSWDIILCDFSHMLLVQHAIFTMQLRHYIGISTSRVSNWGGYLRCSTADSVATREVNCYNVRVQVCSLSQFKQTISQGKRV